MLFTALISLVLMVKAQQDVMLNGEWQLNIAGKDYVVNVPHTYNVMDGLEDYAGEATYKRVLPITPDMKGSTVRLHFEAVYHDAIVYLNGQKVGEHLNKGYTPFSFDITRLIDFNGENTLEVRNLIVCFRSDRGVITPVNDVSLNVPAGQIVGIVGESGCGKSMTARAIMGLLRFPGKVTGGSVLLCGREIQALSEKERRRLRGSEISMIFQEPMTSLNPVMKVGRQVEEALRLHTA